MLKKQNLTHLKAAKLATLTISRVVQSMRNLMNDDGMITDSADSDLDSELSLINTEPDEYFHRFQQRQNIVMPGIVDQELVKCQEFR